MLQGDAENALPRSEVAEGQSQQGERKCRLRAPRLTPVMTAEHPAERRKVWLAGQMLVPKPLRESLHPCRAPATAPPASTRRPEQLARRGQAIRSPWAGPLSQHLAHCGLSRFRPRPVNPPPKGHVCSREAARVRRMRLRGGVAGEPSRYFGAATRGDGDR